MPRVKELAGLPIEQHSSPNVGGRMSDHRGSVLHIAEGTYRGTISWQMNPDQRYASGGTTTTSSTWVVGKNWGEWAQMSDTDTVAWCQRSGSHTRNSIELAGHAGDKPTAWQIEACAQIFAWEHLHYGVALQVADTDAVLGLCHHSADREWAGVEWGHEDCPGKGVIAAKPAIVARAKEIINGGDDVSDVFTKKLGADVNDRTLGQLVQDIWFDFVKGGGGMAALNATLAKIQLTSEAALAAARNDDEAGIKAHIDAKVAELAAGQAAIGDRILAALPAGDGPVSREDLIAALTAVLGSIDGATPQG